MKQEPSTNYHQSNQLLPAVKPDINNHCLQTPSAEEHVDLHFVAIVHKDGSLYELGEHFNLKKYRKNSDNKPPPPQKKISPPKSQMQKSCL